MVVSFSYRYLLPWNTPFFLDSRRLTRRRVVVRLRRWPIDGELIPCAPDLSDGFYSTVLREFRDFNCVAHLWSHELPTYRQGFLTGQAGHMTVSTLTHPTTMTHRPGYAFVWISDTADWREPEVSDAVENHRQTGPLTGISTEDFWHISAQAN